MLGPPYLRLLVPATSSDHPRKPKPYDYLIFTKALIKDLRPFTFDERTFRFNPRDATFGWSHHNYSDVVQMGTALGKGAHATDVAYHRMRVQKAPGKVARTYGPTTQGVRKALGGWWRGWGQQAQPRLWLTEGGALLEFMPLWQAGPPPPSPSSDQHAAKIQQRISVGLAADVLKIKDPGAPGEGVEMFTNFLFYDEGVKVGFYPGLCNTYERTKSAVDEERPVFKDATWTKFGL